MTYGQVSGDEVLRYIGQQMKLLRRRAGIERAELGPRIGYGPDMVGAVERGARAPQPAYMKNADKALDAGGVIAVMSDLVELVRASGGVAAMSLEKATAWHAYAPVAVPELLRTEEYTRAVLTAGWPPLSEGEVEKKVEEQADGWRLLDRDPPLVVTCVIEEAVLRRPYGGWEVLRRQAAHLADLARRRHVMIQIMPTAVEAHPASGGPLELVEPDSDRPTVARIEGRVLTRRSDVRPVERCYGTLRAQALTPAESIAFLEELREPTQSRTEASRKSAAVW